VESEIAIEGRPGSFSAAKTPPLVARNWSAHDFSGGSGAVEAKVPRLYSNGEWVGVGIGMKQRFFFKSCETKVFSCAVVNNGNADIKAFLRTERNGVTVWGGAKEVVPPGSVKSLLAKRQGLRFQKNDAIAVYVQGGDPESVSCLINGRSKYGM